MEPFANQRFKLCGTAVKAWYVQFVVTHNLLASLAPACLRLAGAFLCLPGACRAGERLHLCYDRRFKTAQGDRCACSKQLALADRGGFFLRKLHEPEGH